MCTKCRHSPRYFLLYKTKLGLQMTKSKRWSPFSYIPVPVRIIFPISFFQTFRRPVSASLLIELNRKNIRSREFWVIKIHGLNGLAKGQPPTPLRYHASELSICERQRNSHNKINSRDTFAEQRAFQRWSWNFDRAWLPGQFFTLVLWYRKKMHGP